MSIRPVIAVDGPAAAGKGTLARRLAAHLGLAYLDTGLLYRATGRRLLDAGADPRDPAAAEAAARGLNPADLARGDLRGPEADMAASAVATQPGVRAALLDWQRDFGRTHGAVLDGRDIGTVICPAAPAKLYVTASPEVRAQRRWKQLSGQGEAVAYDDVLADIRRRDARDGGRDTAPMMAAPDAELLDTTEMTIEQAADAARRIVEAARARWVSLREEGPRG
jgi:cytidylate kinase